MHLSIRPVRRLAGRERTGASDQEKMTLTTRLAIAMVTLVAIAVSAVGWLNYHNLEQALLMRARDSIETHSREVATDLENYAASAIEDITSFRSAVALHGLVRAHKAGGTDPVDGVSEKTWRERIANRLAAGLAAKPAYAVARIIGVGDEGRELVRVDRRGPNDTVRIVPDEQLRKRMDRNYFRETIQLNPGQFYVSTLDLGRHNGLIEEKHRPTLRIATPIFASDGTPFGILMVNLDMRQAFDRVRASASPGQSIYVVNRRGDYLIHPDRSREFGWLLGKPADWKADFPRLASQAGSTRGIADIVPDQDGRSGGAALAPAILAGAEWLGVIETNRNAEIMAPAASIRNTSLLVGMIAVLCAAALAVLIARSLTRPIVRLTEAVQGAAGNGKVAIPVEARGETGVLARAFAHAIEEVNAKTVALQQEVEEHRRTVAARDHHAERERLFSAAIESSNDAIITMSLDGAITGWNSAAERLFNYTAAEAAGKNIALLVPDDRLAESQDTMRRIGSGESIAHDETVRLRKDGRRIDVSLSIYPIKSPSGATIGISKVVRDITDANKTRQVLRQQTEELRRIFETSQDLIIVMDSRGFVVQISPSCESILGYRSDEMIGRNGIDFIHPDDLESCRQDMRAARRGQRPNISDARCCTHKDGRSVWLSWLGTWSDPAKRFFFVGRDMTESRRAQETLRESEQLARGIIDTALDAFVQIDERGVIQDWNPQAENILGWSRDEAVGNDVFELMGRQSAPRPLKKALESFLLSGSAVVRQPRRELQIRRRDGKEITVELSIAALRTRDGFLFNGFVRDLTARIVAEERIRQAEKMEAMGQLTGGIAHDFNNILTVITGTIEILANAVKDEPQLAVITRMIDEAASRGADLTQHLLAFARRQPLEPRETDVNALIKDTAILLQRTIGAHVEIESVFADEACPALVDPNQLATAILNLALNARDAMPNGGRLTIETGSAVLDENHPGLHGDVRPGRYAMIAVSDTGAGISAAILDKVFDPFFTSKGPGKGTGLGLSMVYGFVKQSAGHIVIYSEEGHGTTIRMYLPPATDAWPALEPSPAPTVEGGHETILVVEDNKLVRDYVLTQLHSLGYVTLDAANANEALAIVHAGRPFDLLFTDVIMPGLNGRQLADEILRVRPGLRVVFTSGYTEDAIIHHGRLDEDVLLLAKPYRKSDMATIIRKALAD
jgi:PAS domain S-box-containing protein